MKRPKSDVKMHHIHVEVPESVIRELRLLHPEYGSLSAVVRSSLIAYAKRHHKSNIKL